MAMQTGENEQALRKILDMTRMMSLGILMLHFYYYGYGAFHEWQLTGRFSDRLLSHLAATGLYSHFHLSKLLALGLLFISLLGAKGRKAEKLNYQVSSAYLFTGLLVYFFSYLVLLLKIKVTQVVLLYMGLVVVGICSRWRVVPCYQESSKASCNRIFLTSRTRPFRRKNGTWKMSIRLTCRPGTG